MELRLIEEGDEHTGVVHVLDERAVTIGRAPESDIVLSSPYASRRHARVRRAAGGYVIEDLGSKNGVAVNGEPVTRPRPLRHGDRIALPGLELRVDADVETVAAPAAAPSASRAVRVDRERAEVWVHDQAVVLAPKEYLALLLFDERAGKLVTKEELARRVWPEYQGNVNDYNVEAVISRLRRRLDERAGGRQLLVTVRGRGYRLVD